MEVNQLRITYGLGKVHQELVNVFPYEVLVLPGLKTPAYKLI